MRLRYYQEEANQAVLDYWSEKPGNPLVVAATGTGKSMMQASLTGRLLDGWNDLRIMNTTHVVELVEGNFKELIGIRPFAPAGIWSSSLGRQDANAQVMFSQIQTVHDKAKRIGHVDILQVDESHMIPFKTTTTYRRLIDDLLEINPDMKINGFTATDYRLDGGRLTEGEGKLFDDVVYDYGIRRGIDDGYLTPITSKRVETNYDLTGVGRSMGEYKAGAYREAVDTDDLNRLVVEEVLDTEGHRKTKLTFCRGVEHAARIRDEFQRKGRKVELVHGGTPLGERRRLISQLRSGELWGLVNDNVLSTGTNIVNIDLIVDLYKTLSAGRYVQRVGRMTRVIYPPGFKTEEVTAEERRAAIASYLKPNGRYMDFAGNISEHGPVDMVQPKAPGSGNGEAPIRLCPQCQELCHASVRACPCCGMEFVFEEKPRFESRPTDAPIISTNGPVWREVTGRKFKHHPGKGGKADSVCIEYNVGKDIFKEWAGPGHPPGIFKTRSDKYWKVHGGKMPFPASVDEFLDRAAELVITVEVSSRPSAKFKGRMDVIDWKPGVEMALEEEVVKAGRGNLSMIGRTKKVEKKPAFVEIDEIPY